MRFLEPLEDRTLFASYAAANVAELIAAINAANASAAADTITLAAGKTFSLSAVHNTDNGANGLPRVTDRGGLTILGAVTAIERSAASGTPAFRLFDVAARASLTLRNLTLQGGLTPSQGGAIYNGGTLALDGVTVQNNAARGAPGHGTLLGGVDAPGGDALGGGVYSSGDLTITGGTFLNNQAIGGRGQDSRVLYSGDGNKTITSSSRGGNGYGGAVYIAGGTASITASTFTANTAAGGDSGAPLYPRPAAPGGNGFGGGLFAAGRSVALRAVTITGNIARGGLGGGVNGVPGDGIGGGIYILDRANLDDYTVNHVLNNTASTGSPNIAGSYRRLR